MGVQKLNADGVDSPNTSGIPMRRMKEMQPIIMKGNGIPFAKSNPNGEMWWESGAASKQSYRHHEQYEYDQ